jgi:hypothetical protein
LRWNAGCWCCWFKPKCWLLVPSFIFYYSLILSNASCYTLLLCGGYFTTTLLIYYCCLGDYVDLLLCGWSWADYK